MSIFSEEERKLFEGRNLVNVATLGKDGTPRSTAIWVDIDGDEILLNGASSRKWLANLRRNPNVALSIYDHQNPSQQLQLTGEAVSITEEGGEAHIDKLAQKYFGRDFSDHQPSDPRTIVRVKVKAIRGRPV